MQKFEKKMGAKVVVEPDPAFGRAKLSDVIKEFAAPLLDNSENEQASRTAIQVAIVAWNLALMSESEKEEALAEFEAMMDSDPVSRARRRQILESLVERKRTLYADDRRFALNWSIHSPPGDMLHFQVLWTDLDRPTD